MLTIFFPSFCRCSSSISSLFSLGGNTQVEKSKSSAATLKYKDNEGRVLFEARMVKNSQSNRVSMGTIIGDNR